VKHVYAQSRVKRLPIRAIETGGFIVILNCDSDGEDGKKCEVEVRKFDEA
jgi:hypothetical protein